ncbi:magnesium transporter MRS2-F-like isoform X2 [Cicer arietinum]|uniref:Magnesium transporter n=1 Tax=Cicer arietinum TaxID=3827 RepID=A0A1S2YF64_CICAR|nr:magnesium transporter MRS2-F-like [Cicer arietinum]
MKKGTMGRMRNMVEEEMGKTARGVRRKGGGTAVKKSWMVVSETGESHVEDVDKHSIMRRTGLPARDLRVLDPALFHPSSILGRDKAIVVNVECVKAIITANQVFMINSTDPFFIRFLQDLQQRVPPNNNRTPSRTSNEMDGDCEEKPLLEDGSPLLQSGIDSNPPPEIFDHGTPISNIAVTTAPKKLPFEFRALEACIESACSVLEFETQRLEEETYPALDELTSKISSLNLDRVRHIKNRLVTLSGRVQKIADQIEHLLDDDNDMAEMYLTQKLKASVSDLASVTEEYNSEVEDIDESDDSRSVRDKSYGIKPDVEELEMLLEAYFAQINGILQKLTSLSEYVDDTEDYINIMLDDKRNQLLRVSITLNTINMIANAGIVVVGLFGMNIHIDLFDGQPRQFWATTVGTLVGCVLLFLVYVWWGKQRYLLFQ